MLTALLAGAVTTLLIAVTIGTGAGPPLLLIFFVLFAAIVIACGAVANRLADYWSERPFFLRGSRRGMSPAQVRAVRPMLVQDGQLNVPTGESLKSVYRAEDDDFLGGVDK